MTQVLSPPGVLPGTERLLALAEERCRKLSVRLTPWRRQVLSILLEAPRPMGAYALLDHLRVMAGPAAPPAIYRALDFLVTQGLAHRLASQSTYVACMTCGAAPGHAHAFLLCQSCGRATEIEDHRVEHAIASMVGRVGFQVFGRTVEVDGLCSGCASHESVKVSTAPAPSTA
ncbi:transcriptional repressor [Muricoccus aerilatus]|uniref:transcriptional repressor n=1 Tax=Muricoccus aerilatus TaxID=452982 RepID=UPI00069342A1|nr:transcriptional repressor [Roseomonas aerilata]